MRNSCHSRPAGCSITYDLVSGIVPRPWIDLSCCNSCCSCTAFALGSTEFGCCAETGAAIATTTMSTSAPAIRRILARDFAMSFTPLKSAVLAIGGGGRQRLVPPAASGRDRLVIGRLPAPGAGAVAAPRHPLFVDLRNDVAVAGEQRLGRAHLGAQRQLAFGETVGAVFLVLFLRTVGLGAAGAEGTLIHLAA